MGRGVKLRSYMRNFRLEHCMDLNQMAAECRCSKGLLARLEWNDEEVTHPRIAARIARAYHLTEEQFHSLLPKNYRPGPGYDPKRYVEWVEICAPKPPSE